MLGGVLRRTQVLINAPLIGLHVFARRGTTLLHHHRDIVAQRVKVIGIANADIAHGMPPCTEGVCEATHRSKDCQHLLRMMSHVISFAAHFHHHVHH